MSKAGTSLLPSAHPPNRSRVKRLSSWLAQHGERALAAGQDLVILGGVVVVLALQVPWLAAPLEHLGLEPATSTSEVVLLVVAGSIYFIVKEIRQHMNAGADRIEMLPNPIAVYPVLLDRASKVHRDEDKRLDVLGMTLYTAWPSIQFYIGQSTFANWTVRLCAVVEDSLNNVPGGWVAESESNLQSIQSASMSAAITGNNVTLEAYGYDFMPVVHGFRLGNGDLFLSFLGWDEDGLIGRESYSYEFVPHEDESDAAQAKRTVFDSWFTRAMSRPWPAQ
jgi:hypothetical protein